MEGFSIGSKDDDAQSHCAEAGQGENSIDEEEHAQWACSGVAVCQDPEDEEFIKQRKRVSFHC